MFLQPVTWLEYCTEIKTPDICASGKDTIAKMFPEDDSPISDEFFKNSYYLEGLYFGHFRNTSASICDDDGNNCHGYFLGSSCRIDSSADAMMYWNNIPMLSSGQEIDSGYNHIHRGQILNAALHHKAHIMIEISSPGALLAKDS